jgi:ribonucleoside-diphosphate reductase alpha chain
VKDDEWDEVIDWLWNNRNIYNGITVLPYDGGTYVQAPFEECSQSKYEELEQYIHNIDLSKVIEYQDDTTLGEELACSGSSCEIN